MVHTDVSFVQLSTLGQLWLLTIDLSGVNE